MRALRNLGAIFDVLLKEQEVSRVKLFCVKKGAFRGFARELALNQRTTNKFWCVKRIDQAILRHEKKWELKQLLDSAIKE